MKRIYFGKNFKNGTPFWQPWGLLGCLGRLLGFILLLFALLLLLSLFRGCNKDSDTDGPLAQVSDPDWNQPIEGGESVGLPSPEENVLPPFQDSEPIPNPENGGATETYPNQLNEIFDSEANHDIFKT